MDNAKKIAGEIQAPCYEEGCPLCARRPVECPLVQDRDMEIAQAEKRGHAKGLREAVEDLATTRKGVGPSSRAYLLRETWLARAAELEKESDA